MRKSPLALAIPAFLAMAGTSNAALIASDFFNGYGTTSVDVATFAGGTGWDSGWTGSDNYYKPGTNLSYTAVGYNDSGNLTGGGNGAVGFTASPAQSIAPRGFTTTATTLWFSALVSVGSVASGENALLWIDSPANGNSGAFVGILAGNVQMRYNFVNFAATPAAATTSSVHLLLAKVELNVSEFNDRLSFWFDPNLAGGEGGLGAALYTQADIDTFGDSISAIGIQTNGSGAIDAIRVGSTFADVTSVPEPSAALLGSFGLLALLRRRR